MTNAAPGWYPVEGGQRYYDGTAWTEHFQPDAPPAPATPGPATAPAAVDPDTLWQAVGKPLAQIGGGKYRLTSRFLFFEKGGLRTNAQQVPIEEVHDVDAAQTMPQKARSVGTITLTVRRASGTETVKLEDVPNFREGVHAINDAAHKRRDEIQTRSNTQTVNYSGGAPAAVAAPPVAAPAPASADEVFSQLERLGKLRDAGVVTEAEFDAKKAELLARL